MSCIAGALINHRDGSPHERLPNRPLGPVLLVPLGQGASSVCRRSTLPCLLQTSLPLGYLPFEPFLSPHLHANLPILSSKSIVALALPGNTPFMCQLLNLCSPSFVFPKVPNPLSLYCLCCLLERFLLAESYF